MNKLKLVGTGIIAFSFLMAITLSSCGTASNQADDDGDAATEEHVDATSDEHPAAEADEHPAGEEHPADSTATEGGEHPQ